MKKFPHLFRWICTSQCENVLTIVKSSSGCSWGLLWTVIFGIDKNSFNICALIGTFPEVSDHRIEPGHSLLVHRDHSLIQRWVIFVQIFNNAFFDLSLSKVLNINFLTGNHQNIVERNENKRGFLSQLERFLKYALYRSIVKYKWPFITY